MLPIKRTYFLIVFLCAFFLISHTFTVADEIVIHDGWDITRMAGDDAGWTHSKIVKIVKDDGSVIFKTDSESNLSIKRLGSEITCPSGKHV